MFNQIIASITIAVQTLVGSLFSMVPQEKVLELETKVSQLELRIQDFENISLGSYYAVTGKYYRLWGSGINSSDASVVLTSFKSPVNDQELSMANFGSEVGYGSIEPENVSNVEIISFTGITQDSGSEKATLTGVVRGINFVYPYNSSTTLAKSHSGGSRFIITDPSISYSEYPSRRNNEMIYGDWTYMATNTPQYISAPAFNSGSNEFATVKYAEDQANLGAATASTSTKGIVTIGTSEQRKNFSTTTSDGGQLILRLWDFATSTDKHGATTTPVMTDTDGKIDQSFLDKTEEFAWSGAHSFTASSTNYGTSTFNGTTTIGYDGGDSLYINASTTVAATTTFKNATTTFDRPPKVDSTSANATSSDWYNLATQGYVTSKNLIYEEATNTDAHTPTNSNWQDWDVSTSSPSNAVYLEVVITVASGNTAGLRKDGSSSSRIFDRTAGASTLGFTSTVIASSTTRQVEIICNVATTCYFGISGWWKPGNF